MFHSGNSIFLGCEAVLFGKPAGSRLENKKSTIVTLHAWPPNDGLKQARNM
jgi:hypothetical protein